MPLIAHAAEFVHVTSKALTRAILPPDSGLEVLAVQRVSKTQAWQRTGRAGREDSGICYRLYTEDEFEKFEKMTVPEIQRQAQGAPTPALCPEASVPVARILQLTLLGGRLLPRRLGGQEHLREPPASLTLAGVTWRA